MSGATENENVVVGFRDHDRRRCAPKIPIADAGEFNIASFREDGSPMPDGGEFRVTLVELRGSLLPHVEAFGEGTGALRRAIDLGLFDQLGAVRDHVEFSERLVAIGLADLSDLEFGEQRLSRPDQIRQEDRRAVLGAMRSGEWLRTQWIARVAFALGAGDWKPSDTNRILAILRELHQDGMVERRFGEDHREGEIGEVAVSFEVSRAEWRLHRECPPVTLDGFVRSWFEGRGVDPDRSLSWKKRNEIEGLMRLLFPDPEEIANDDDGDRS